MPESPEVRYAEREQQYARLRDEQRRKSAVLARLRLTTFLPAIATLVWWLGFYGGIPAFVLTVVLLLAFGALVVMHARVEERAERFEALRTVNVRGTARLKRDWDAPAVGAGADGTSTEGHPYAADLDVFGRASLFQWIGPGATEYGHRILATWLLSPASAPEITSRQAALAELAPLDGWREQLAAFGVLAAAQRPDSIAAFRRWAERPGPALRRLPIIRAAVYLIVVSLWIFGGLHFSGVMPNSLWGVPLLAGIALSFATAWAVTHAFDEAGAGERTLAQYASIFEHIDSQRFTSPRLEALQRSMSGNGRPAPLAMRSLNRILAFADLRRGAALLHFPIQALTLWDFHCLFALEAWRRDVGARVGTWLEGCRGTGCAFVPCDHSSRLSRLAQSGCDDRRDQALPGRRPGPPVAPGEPARRQRRTARATRNGPARDRLEHVGEEHAAARNRRERGPCPVRRPGVRGITAASALRPSDEHQDPGLSRARRVVLHGGARAPEGRGRCR